MTQFHIVEDWLQVAIIGAFFAAALFPLIGFVWPFWKTEFGWNVVAKTTAIALALFPVFLRRIGVVLTLLELAYISAVSITAVWAIIIWRALVIYKTQRRGALEERQRLHEEEEEV